MKVLVSFIFVIILNTLTFKLFALFGKHIFQDKSSIESQLSLHLPKLIING